MTHLTGRFAPSPSGRMHLGNLFSALLAWTSIRSRNGEMILRIEDLDRLRCPAEYAEIIKEDMLWLGLDWDREMPWQSTRTPAYDQALAFLQEKGLVYPCWCTRGDLHAASAPHASDGHAIYPGTCRHLTPTEQAAHTTPASLRLVVPDREFSFVDGLQGEYRENLALDCGDFVIRKADGTYAYQLAVVVDDGEGHVNEVVRGCDLLGSTPRQLYLQEQLGLPHPCYYHVPLLLAPDGHRLSKREKDLDMGVLRQKYTPAELTGKLAFLAGLLPKPEPITPKELASVFTWDKVNHQPILTVTE